MNTYNTRRLKQIILLLIIVVICWLAYWIIRSQIYSARVSLQITPLSSTIYLNNVQVAAGTIAVKPGKLTVTASRAGFSTQSQTVIASKGKVAAVNIALLPNSTSTASWYSSHPKDQKELEVITGNTYNLNEQKAVRSLPLIKDLPFVDSFYRIDYGASKLHPNNPGAVAIYITYYSTAGKQQALEWLEFKGYNPTNLEIYYTDDTNKSF